MGRCLPTARRDRVGAGRLREAVMTTQAGVMNDITVYHARTEIARVTLRWSGILMSFLNAIS